MRKVTKGMRKRIKRTAIKVKMVKRTTTAGGKVSVYFDLYTYISLLLFPFQISKLAFLLCISPSDIFAKGQNYIYIVASLELRSGGSYMKRSAAYPRQFGEALCKHHQRFIDACLNPR